MDNVNEFGFGGLVELSCCLILVGELVFGGSCECWFGVCVGFCILFFFNLCLCGSESWY